ncbi:MAG: DUF4349 domain-containing protein, partial [Chloroflexota bacterium]
MRARFGHPSLSLHRSRTVIALLLVTLLSSVLLAACGGAAMKVEPALNSGVPAPAAVPEAPSLERSSSSAPAADNSSPSSASSTTADQIPPINRMVVHNAQLSLQVKDVDVALGRLRDIAQANGGYVSTEHASASQSGDQAGNPARTVADVTIRVRADEYNQALAQIRSLASKVV